MAKLSPCASCGKIVKTKFADIGKRKQEIIDRGAGEGKTIEIDAFRRTMQDSQAAYTGPDRDAYASELDRLLDSLTTRYGNCIPVDHAYRIMQHLEAGRGFTP